MLGLARPPNRGWLAAVKRFLGEYLSYDVLPEEDRCVINISQYIYLYVALPCLFTSEGIMTPRALVRIFLFFTRQAGTVPRSGHAGPG